MNIKRFDIWMADLNPGKGTVPGKIRPVIVIQSDGFKQSWSSFYYYLSVNF